MVGFRPQCHAFWAETFPGEWPIRSMNALHDTLKTVAERVLRHRSKAINEQDTKASLISPVLRSLGWDVEDLEVVLREYRQRKQDKPVDFALCVRRQPCLFVEAKALGENLDDRKWANQIMGYAAVAGVRWVVLTDGDQYRLYNSHAPVPIEEKLFRSVRVTDESTRPVETLSLLACDRIQENEIDVLWQAHFVDGKVRGALQELFAAEAEPNPTLIRLLKSLTKLSGKDIKASLQRARVQFDFPVQPDVVGPPSHTEGDRTAAAKKAWATRRRREGGQDGSREKRGEPGKRPGAYRQRFGVTKGEMLGELVQRGVLKAGTKLLGNYRGRDIEAELSGDGTILLNGKRYSTPSAAGGHVKSVLTGKQYCPTDGWKFWRYRDDRGNLVMLREAREKYLKLQVK